MKELTIEEKAKAYDEAIERAKEYWDVDIDNTMNVCAKGTIEYLFPELKEPEEERIRKWLINYFREVCDNVAEKEKNAVIAWLEEQVEQKAYTLEQAANIFLDALSNSPYNNKPITDAQIITKQLLNFLQNSASYNPDALIANEQEPTDEAEPKFKKGDVIRRKDGDGLEWTVENVHKDGYYTIVNSDRDDFILLDDNWELVEQKPAWSEEDEMILFSVIWYLRDSVNNGDQSKPAGKLESWISSLKDRVQPKQEWSEEDESMRTRCIGILGKCYMGELPTKAEEELNWLKSLKDRYTWKPSDEQIEVLEWTLHNWTGKTKEVLESLYEDLKKLRKG